MYAIAFDLKGAVPQQYKEVRTYLEANGFAWTQGSVYIGGTDAVAAVVVAQGLASKFPWFKSTVRDIRLLRVEENNDLRPALGLGPADASDEAQAA